MGFYYDKQMSDPEMTIRLYSNRKYDQKSGSFTSSTKEYDNLLATAILNEDFQVEVNNNWTGFDGGNAIEGLWNAAKPYAAVMGDMSNFLKKFTVDESDTSFLGEVMNTVAKGANWIANNKDSGYLDRALIVQGTRFSYYSGTDISLGNMTLKFTVFHRNFSSSDGGNVSETVHDQIDKLKPYVIGKYVGWNDDDGTGKKVNNSASNINSTLGEVSSKVGEYIGWQNPPGGFKSQLRSIGVDTDGTLKLEIGSKYAISNLVIRNMSITYSRHSVKPIPSASSINTQMPSPLYADVILTLQPLGLITSDMLDNFTKGYDMSLKTLENIRIKKDKDKESNNT